MCRCVQHFAHHELLLCHFRVSYLFDAMCREIVGHFPKGRRGWLNRARRMCRT